MARKNNLGSKTPITSTLNDVDVEKAAHDLGFAVELTESEAPAAPKYEMELGEHTVRAIRLGQFETSYQRNRFGDEYEIPAHWEILWEDIKTHETSTMIVSLDRKAEDSFKRAINLRSGKDLGVKLANAGIQLTSISFKTAVQYCHKNPIKMVFDFSEWVDKDTNELKRSKRPKLQLWSKEDFEDNRPKKWISHDK